MSLHRAIRSCAALALVATIPGCASTSSARPARDALDGLPPIRREHDRLTAREIATTPGFPTAYEVLGHFRHEYLQPMRTGRAGTGSRRPPAVFINNAPAGDVEALRSVPTHLVVEIRLVRPDDAYRRFGSEYPAGVILVTTKR